MPTLLLFTDFSDSHGQKRLSVGISLVSDLIFVKKRAVYLFYLLI